MSGVLRKTKPYKCLAKSVPGFSDEAVRQVMVALKNLGKRKPKQLIIAVIADFLEEYRKEPVYETQPPIDLTNLERLRHIGLSIQNPRKLQLTPPAPGEMEIPPPSPQETHSAHATACSHQPTPPPPPAPPRSMTPPPPPVVQTVTPEPASPSLAPQIPDYSFDNDDDMGSLLGPLFGDSFLIDIGRFDAAPVAPAAQKLPCGSLLSYDYEADTDALHAISVIKQNAFDAIMTDGDLSDDMGIVFPLSIQYAEDSY